MVEAGDDLCARGLDPGNQVGGEREFEELNCGSLPFGNSVTYPGMARTAREEGFDEIAEWFETLAKAEKSHAGRFQRALDQLA
jgi:rubrerythrin